MKYDAQQLGTLMGEFGCTAREAKIYLHALSVGPATIQQYARNLRENRVTIHSAVEKLIEKGFIYESRRGKQRILAAADPKIFQRLTQEKRNALDLLEPDITHVTEWLQSIKKIDQSTPSIKFYEGVDGLKHMLEESLSSKNEILVFTFVDLFSKLLTPGYLKNYYARRAKLHIPSRLIFPSGEFGKQIFAQAKTLGMEIRFLAPDTEWKSGFFSWNNILAIQSFTEGKITCTIIENDDIAFFYRKVVYGLCWQQASPIPLK